MCLCGVLDSSLVVPHSALVMMVASLLLLASTPPAPVTAQAPQPRHPLSHLLQALGRARTHTHTHTVSLIRVKMPVRQSTCTLQPLLPLLN
jgi:hypothetical protein